MKFLAALISFLLILYSAVSAEIQYDENDAYYSRNISAKGQSSTNTYAQAIHYGQTTPQRDGASWSGWCAALMMRAGNFPSGAAAPTAIDAYHRSRVISKDIYSAPNGAMHWWDIGSAGHVAMAMPNGWAMMASCHIEQSWGDCIGTTPVADYTKTTGATYLGWSYDYCGAEIADVHNNNPTSNIPQSNTASTGVPDTYYYMRQQRYASLYGYTGPIDGILGKNSWAGTQRGLRNYGYTGPDDGVPGVNTYKAMQRLAAQWGYTGPVDGELGPNSYKGICRYFNTL